LVVGEGADPAFVDQLLAAVESPAASSPDGANTGNDLALGVARLLVSGDPGRAPSFAVACATDGGVLILLHGDVEAGAEGPGGVIRESGRDALIWVDRVVSEPVERVWARRTDPTPVAYDPRVDLRSGRVPGAGFALAFVNAAPPDDAAPPVESEPPTEPELALPEPPAHNDRGPIRIGAALTVDLAPAGLLVADDGTAVVLDGDYVIGREPGVDGRVRDGRARGLALDDPDHLVSRVHACVVVQGDVVSVRDAGSANGTFVAPPGATEWKQISDETVLERGWCLRIGRRVFTFTADPPSAG
jgi:hypothetical protein